MRQPLILDNWQSLIEQRFKILGVGVILIALYSLYQGGATLISTISVFSKVEVSKNVASIQICFILIGVFAVVGSVGMVMVKRWGVKMLKWCYIAVIPFTFFGIYHSGSKDTAFILFRAMDMLIGFIIIYILSHKSTIKRFV